MRSLCCSHTSLGIFLVRGLGMLRGRIELCAVDAWFQVDALEKGNIKCLNGLGKVCIFWRLYEERCAHVHGARIGVVDNVPLNVAS
jgi:hypothetical protein